MALDLANKVIKFLKEHPEQRFKALEIANWIVNTYSEESRKKQARSKNIKLLNC